MTDAVRSNAARHASPAPGRGTALRGPRSRLSLALVPALLLAPLAAPLQAARVQIVLDVSGSMRASAGGMTRMEAAQRAVKATVEAIDPGSVVALRLYGHRLPSEPKAASCEDTELVIPFGPLDRRRFVEAVEAARPLGQTPLAYSLERAAADFGDVGDEPAVVILVSDGEESCGGDPAKVACAFAERGLELTVHTVGFDVGALAREQLQAIARCTGGEYRDARNAGELADSLRQLTQAGLLVEKKRGRLGNEVRGGDGFESAVPLSPGTYRLDHHQRLNEFDYFSVDVPAGRLLRVSQEAYEIGVTIQGDSFREGLSGVSRFYSLAGVALYRPDRSQVGAQSVDRPGKKASVSTAVTAGNAGRYFVAIGANGNPAVYGDSGIHKDSPITIELVDQSDARSGTDAGDTDRTPAPLPDGESAAWIQLVFSREKDVFRVEAAAGERFEIRARPERQDPVLSVTATDGDGVVLATAKAPGPGAAVRLESVAPPRPGPFYVTVLDARPDYLFPGARQPETEPAEYRIALTRTGGAAPASAAGEAPADGAVPARNRFPGSIPGGWLTLALLAAAVLVLVVVAGAVGYFAGSRRRAGR